MPGSNADAEHRVREEARTLLRRWLAGAEDEVAASINAIGARAIRSAAEAAVRLDRLPRQRSATATLANLDALAADIAGPARPARRRLFTRSDPPAPDIQHRIGRLVDDLDRERDAITRTAIQLSTDRERLTEAAAELDRAIALIRAVAAAVAAAARELASDRPDRARYLRELAGPRLVEREQDILSQAAVTQQGLLTLALLAEGQDALGRALTRARELSAAALRTAVAARRATVTGAEMMSDAAILDQATGTGEPDRDLGRALASTLDQARREINAADVSASHRTP